MIRPPTAPGVKPSADYARELWIAVFLAFVDKPNAQIAEKRANDAVDRFFQRFIV